MGGMRMKKGKRGFWVALAGSLMFTSCQAGTLSPLAAVWETDSRAEVISEGDALAAELQLAHYRVTTRDECRRLLKELASQVRGPDRQEFLVTGEDFEPDSLVLAQIFPDLVNISNTVLVSEQRDGHNDTTCRIGFERKRDAGSCEHDWEVETQEEAGCTTAGREVRSCGLCGETQEEILEPLGHTDFFDDTVCDRCGRRFREQKPGEMIPVDYENSEGIRYHEFICVGDWKNEGTLYRSSRALPYSITQESTVPIEGSAEEKLRWWLQNDFLNGLTVRTACRQLLLLDEEGVPIEEGAWNESSEFYVGLVLERCEEESPEIRSWAIGDIRLCLIGDETYRFRCIDDDYRNPGYYNQRNALFLCEAVIRSDIDSSDTQREILTFGKNNNYKTSNIRQWLRERENSGSGFVAVETGVNSAFLGSTETGAFGELTDRGLTERALPAQYCTDRLFILSVREALQYRNELWDNAAGESAFSRGYWLRTPVYEESEDGSFTYGTRGYVADLENGCIRPAEVSDGAYGIRPAFCLPQA